MKLIQKNLGTLFIIVGPSRVGKDSILRALLKRRSLGLKKLVTTTTRPRRPREIAGRTYHYLTEAEFVKKIKNNELLEWAPVRNYRFGTPKEPLMTWLSHGQNVIQQVDVRGATAMKKIKSLKTTTIFILPGSIKELKKRFDATTFTSAQRKIRWEETTSELKRQTEFDYRVVNSEGKIDKTVKEVAQIIEAIILKNR